MFKEILLKELKLNPFYEIGEKWMLVTPSAERINPMTASWGGMGVLWHKNVVFVFMRPTRFTYKLMEENDYFTLTFFDEEYKDILTYCGTKSGFDVDKIKETGLTKVESDGFIYFEEADLVYCCKKIYFDDIKSANFLDKEIDTYYPKKDYHRMYVGEIVKVLKKV
ncbi:flavin reductase family protein [Deferribacter autotrophicus]|uniref:Flavin reductase family protein n=1 Tax=Deferribacter autotrophicus TaxID=500465 RepID=A0A5A8F813_9BACT|nr:flavin reductase [Deferribacter autotrophicus]KAA0258168.1 flavin reductase family protein [Deferribacter autotrophicus]